jgi:hypothetical protein
MLYFTVVFVKKRKPDLFFRTFCSRTFRRRTFRRRTFRGRTFWWRTFCRCILSRIYSKKERKKLGQDLTHLAHTENIAEWNFSVRQAKNLNCILFSKGSDIRCHLTWLKYWPYLAHSPNTLNAAKVLTKSKKNYNLYLISWIQWNVLKNQLTLLSL